MLLTDIPQQPADIKSKYKLLMCYMLFQSLKPKHCIKDLLFVVGVEPT